MVNLDLGGPRFRRPRLLLHPPIPQSLFGVNPRSVLGREWWDTTRQEAYAANNYHCWACGEAPEGGLLAGHECFDYDDKKLVAKYTQTVALCPDCHAFIHKGHTMSTRSKRATRRIFKRGNGILYRAGIRGKHLDKPKWRAGGAWTLDLSVVGKGGGVCDEEDE